MCDGEHSQNHFTVVSALAEFGAMSQLGLAAKTGLNQGHLVGFLDELERDGSVARSSDPEDRRRNIVELTTVGEGFAKEVALTTAQSEAAVFRVLSEVEQQQLLQLLTKIVSNHTGVRP